MTSSTVDLVVWSLLNKSNIRLIYEHCLFLLVSLRFGGGPESLSDQITMMESMLLRELDIELRVLPEEVELVIDATIHTKHGLWWKTSKMKLLCQLY